ncbi:uncharacterized protein LOC100572118 [Acyrthosiphon pisum]|uniref:C2H2-type domain-containing protein n=1 Tax=Acyrthosiphon pisum TaxID=7029 RepID=A0A8R2H6R1_ACYPI|nr:uncharacterized protein LOC100572118 [Acyrthosiphon pisum]|eukprot:XP_016658427.1 PREDICTED: uncharacterized protein LOC100572118 [Acyrthosiphon pisum]
MARTRACRVKFPAAAGDSSLRPCAQIIVRTTVTAAAVSAPITTSRARMTGPPLTCELCGHLSINRSKYDRHVSAAHPEALAATCGVCHTYLGDVSSLIDHVQRRARPRDLSRSVRGRADLRTVDPIRRVAPAEYTCTVCGSVRHNRFMYVHRRCTASPMTFSRTTRSLHGRASQLCAAVRAPTAQCPMHPRLCAAVRAPTAAVARCTTTMCSSPVHPQPQWPDSTTTMCSSPVHPQPQWSGASTAMCSSPVHPQLCSTPVNP